jgi:TonB family protein
MSAFRFVVASIIVLAVLALRPVSAAPPQPPLTNDTLADWREEAIRLGELEDNAFLYEEAAGEFGRHIAAWQGADVVLSLEVERVTKEAVECKPLFGALVIRNEQPPVAAEETPLARARAQRRFPPSVTLRIADVIPLETARNLRQRDMLVVQGLATTTGFQPGTPIFLEVTKARAVATVTREHSGPRVAFRPAALEELRPPPYPAAALMAGVDGQAVVTVARGGELSLARSSGNHLLDEAVLRVMQPARFQGSEFLGEHRFTFAILRR